MVDTKANKILSVAQAIRRGIIEPQNSSFMSSADGLRLTFQDALQQGYIISEELNSDVHLNGDTTSIDVMEASTGPNDYEVDNVLDPRTKYRVSLPYAISKGIVKPSDAEYRNPETGEFMSLSDAVSKGVVKAAKVTPGSSVKAIVNLLQMHDTGVTPVRYVLPRAKQDPSVCAYKALSKYMDSNTKSVKNHAGDSVSVREAFQSGIIKFDSLSYVQPDSSTISLEGAAQEGLVSMDAMQCILGACKKLSLQSWMDSGRITPDGSAVVVGDSAVDIGEAVDQGKIDPYSVFMRDKGTGNLVTLGYAVDEDLISLEEGRTLSRRLSSAEIIPNVAASAELKAAYVVEKLSEHNKDITIKNPNTGDCLPLREAVNSGLYDTQHAEVVDQNSGRRLPLAAAVEEGLVSKEDAKSLYNAMDSMSLSHTISEHMVDGEWYSADSRSASSLRDAIDNGTIIPDTVYFVDQPSGRIGTLATSISEGNAICSPLRQPSCSQTVTLATPWFISVRTDVRAYHCS